MLEILQALEASNDTAKNLSTIIRNLKTLAVMIKGNRIPENLLGGLTFYKYPEENSDCI